MKIPYWLHFDLYVSLPLLRIKTCAMTHVYERDMYMYYQIHTRLWKWEFNFEIGRRGH